MKSVRNDVNRQIQRRLAQPAEGRQRRRRADLRHPAGGGDTTVWDLPPATGSSSRLRVTYPEASLKELGQRATPPLSRAPSITRPPPRAAGRRAGRGGSAGSPIEVVNGFSNFSLVLYFLQ